MESIHEEKCALKYVPEVCGKDFGKCALKYVAEVCGEDFGKCVGGAAVRDVHAASAGRPSSEV